MDRATTEYLRKLGNPYAKLSMVDESTRRCKYIRTLQNPYASLGVSDDQPPSPEGIEDDAPILAARPMKISKRDFAIRCRSIFVQYTPLAKGTTRLRPEYVAFISENGDKDPEDRARIIAELERYDLACLGNVKPHLNRERESQLLNKLRAISNSSAR